MYSSEKQVLEMIADLVGDEMFPTFQYLYENTSMNVLKVLVHNDKPYRFTTSMNWKCPNGYIIPNNKIAYQLKLIGIQLRDKTLTPRFPVFETPFELAFDDYVATPQVKLFTSKLLAYLLMIQEGAEVVHELGSGEGLGGKNQEYVVNVINSVVEKPVEIVQWDPLAISDIRSEGKVTITTIPEAVGPDKTFQFAYDDIYYEGGVKAGRDIEVRRSCRKQVVASVHKDRFEQCGTMEGRLMPGNKQFLNLLLMPPSLHFDHCRDCLIIRSLIHQFDLDPSLVASQIAWMGGKMCVHHTGKGLIAKAILPGARYSEEQGVKELAEFEYLNDVNMIVKTNNIVDGIDALDFEIVSAISLMGVKLNSFILPGGTNLSETRPGIVHARGLPIKYELSEEDGERFKFYIAKSTRDDFYAVCERTRHQVMDYSTVGGYSFGVVARFQEMGKVQEILDRDDGVEVMYSCPFHPQCNCWKFKNFVAFKNGRAAVCRYSEKGMRFKDLDTAKLDYNSALSMADCCNLEFFLSTNFSFLIDPGVLPILNCLGLFGAMGIRDRNKLSYLFSGIEFVFQIKGGTVTFLYYRFDDVINVNENDAFDCLERCLIKM